MLRKPDRAEPPSVRDTPERETLALVTIRRRARAERQATPTTKHLVEPNLLMCFAWTGPGEQYYS